MRTSRHHTTGHLSTFREFSALKSAPEYLIPTKKSCDPEQLAQVGEPKSCARHRVAGQLPHPLLSHRFAPDGAL